MMFTETSLWALVLVVFSSASQILCSGEGHCVWYGVCGDNPNNGKKYNCEYSGAPRTISDKSHADLLKEMCPEYAGASDGSALTCCDREQLENMKADMTIAWQFIQRCPSCQHNFRRYYCAMTCSPVQSRFVHPLEFEEATEPGKERMNSVTKIQFVVSPSYAENFFTSCRNVSSAGMKAIDAMCGPHGYDKCTSKLWLESMGENEYAPFYIQMNFSEHLVHEHGKTFHPLKLPTVPCNKPVTPLGQSCSCSDCLPVCEGEEPLFELPTRNSKPFTIGGVDGMFFISVMVFAILTFGFICYLMFLRITANRRLMKRDHSNSNANQASKESLPLQDSSTSGDDGKMEEAKKLNQEEAGVQTSVSVRQVIPTVIIIPNWYQNFSMRFEESVERFFYNWGRFCAQKPLTVLCLGLFISSTLSLGVLFFSVVTDPLELWAMPNSRARLEKEYFDSHFQPFYRTEHVIVTAKHNEPYLHNDALLGSVFRPEVLEEAFQLHQKIMSISAVANNRTIRLKDICFVPMYPDNQQCAVMSLFSYNNLQNKSWLWNEDNYLSYFQECFDSHLSPKCLGTYGGPLFPYVTLGGFSKNYTKAEALVFTFLVNNYYNKTKNNDAILWEAEFVKLMKNYNSSHLNVFFSAERSIQDELDRESRSDITTILISYLIMFCYISIGLGQANNCQRLLVDSKITLGLGGIVLVIMSVIASVGIFGFLGIPATLIVVEVVPFMCLAVGVDNIFILVQAFQRDERQPNEPKENQIGRVVSQVAPSMFLSSITDACGFYLGALSSMPAVQTFGLYAGTALLIAFLLQITCFVSLMSLDCRRQESGRIDICCWIQTTKSESIRPTASLLYRIFKNIYAPFLMKTPIRICVIITFLGWLCSSIAVINKIEIGLDQELSMPRDSYMLHYFEALKTYLAVGPPVYFVVKSGYNYSSPKKQNKICSSVHCEKDSLLNQISYASSIPEKTYIAQQAISWLDDYSGWLSNGLCCKMDPSTQTFCPSSANNCSYCPVKSRAEDAANQFSGETFSSYLPFYLKDNPSPSGCIGGHPAYSTAVELLNDNRHIGATHFMTYHTILKSSKDYYEALWWARHVADLLTKKLNEGVNSDGQKVEVFPYSVFYVFYEQYLTIWEDTLRNLFFSSITIFVMAFFLLGLHLHLAAIISVTVTMIVINLMGIMYWWNIQLNAVSLVNLVVAIGIAVEFCSHITRAFGVSTKETKILRTQEALVTMGSSVLCGITFTKFTGILVLYFAKSLIFQIFYFRINLCIVLFGAAHGLIFLPCFLSFFGPSANKRKLNEQQQALLAGPYRMDENESTS